MDTIVKQGDGNNDSSDSIVSAWTTNGGNTTKDVTGVFRIGSLNDARNANISLVPTATPSNINQIIALMDAVSVGVLAKIKMTTFENLKTDYPALEQGHKYVAVAEFLVADSLNKQKRYKLTFPYVNPQDKDPNTNAATGLSAINTFFSVQANCDLISFVGGQTSVKFLGSYKIRMQ